MRDRELVRGGLDSAHLALGEGGDAISCRRQRMGVAVAGLRESRAGAEHERGKEGEAKGDFMVVGLLVWEDANGVCSCVPNSELTGRSQFCQLSFHDRQCRLGVAHA